MRNIFRIIIVNAKCKIDFKIDNETEDEDSVIFEVSGEKF